MSKDEEFNFFEEPTEEPTVEPTPEETPEKASVEPAGEPTVGTTPTGGANKPRGAQTKALKEELEAFKTETLARLVALERTLIPQSSPPNTPALSDGMKQDFATAIRTWLSSTKPINTKTGKPNPSHDSPEINEKRIRMVKLLAQMTNQSLEDTLAKTKLTEWWAANGPKPEA